MYIIATDILADVCGLSLGLMIALVPVGLMLWLLGWWSHRFWIVLTTTVLAGVFGLLEATSWRGQPIVVAVLLAIAAGVLALALVRVITFAIGGALGVYLLQLFVPTLNQPMIGFLISGLVCLLLFRWFFMALTSLLGASLLTYAALALLHYYGLIDAIVWSEERSLLLTSLCGAATLTGFVFQWLLDRARTRRRRAREEDGEEDGNVVTAVLGKIGVARSRRRAA